MYESIKLRVLLSRLTETNRRADCISNLSDTRIRGSAGHVRAGQDVSVSHRRCELERHSWLWTSVRILSLKPRPTSSPWTTEEHYRQHPTVQPVRRFECTATMGTTGIERPHCERIFGRSDEIWCAVQLPKQICSTDHGKQSRACIFKNQPPYE